MSSTPLDPAEDALLVTRFQQGDRRAFEQLVKRHQGRLFSLAHRVTRNEAQALEIVQETFLQAFQKLPDFRGDAAVGSWLHRIAMNFALMHLRHRRVVDAVEEPLEPEVGKFREDGHWDEPPTGLWGRRADDLVLDAELRDKILAAVDLLPDSYRVVFVLRDVEGLSYEEISEATETTVASVKSRLHRARLALRESLGNYFDGRGA